MHIPHISLAMMKNQYALQYLDDFTVKAIMTKQLVTKCAPTILRFKSTKLPLMMEYIDSSYQELASHQLRAVRLESFPRCECGLWQLRSDLWPIRSAYTLCLQRRKLKRFQNEPTIERPKQQHRIMKILYC